MHDNADVIIIGAGASGAAAAWKLSQHFSNVVCLEQGDWVDPNKYPSTKSNWELDKTRKFSPFPNIRNLPSDYPINDTNSAISIANYNAVGGSTILYSAHFPRMHPSDFSTLTLDNVGADWPITYKDLEEFYELNDQIMGVSGLEGDPAYPNIPNLLPPIGIGQIGEILAKGFNKLKWHWWPSYSAILTRDKNGRSRCQNLGPCNTGCPQGAKASVDITYWPLNLKNGVKLRTNSRVREIITNSKDEAKGVIYYDIDGNERVIYSKIIVLASNGVGTPRILLNSKSQITQKELANRSGLVGKNLMLHPLGFIEGFFSRPFESNIGPHGSCLLSQEFYETDISRGFARGFTMQVLRGSYPLELVKSGIQRRLIRMGEHHVEDFKNIMGSNIGISIICEDLPELSNRVSLDPNLKDSNGIPAPKIDYKLGENTKKMLSFGLKKGKELLNECGAKNIFAYGPVRNTGWHLMGTTKMGLDRETSVVNKDGMCHDVKNLYIVDSSVFPTSGGVNPASTIQALALFISSKIIEHSKNS